MSQAEAGVQPPKITTRQVAAAVIGNALEFYDFTIYAFFAVQIGHAFFPNHSGYISLLLSLGTFGAGFILRPIGAFVLGRFADRRGRRPAMLVSFALMGVAILGVALTPGYAIGDRRARAGAVLAAVPGLRARRRGRPDDRLSGGGVAARAPRNCTARGRAEARTPPISSPAWWAWRSPRRSAEPRWPALGWRIAFMLGALVLPFGLLLRRNLPETLHHADASEGGRGGHRRTTRVVILGFGLVAATTVSTYVFNFMTTYAQTTCIFRPPSPCPRRW